MTYNKAELDSAALLDLLSDAECAESQSKNGPFFPERGITAASLAAYAAKCRDQVARYRDGGAHSAILKTA